MKVEQLKLYNKYKDIEKPNIEYIYIGITNNHYIFLYKNEIINLSFSNLNFYGLNPDKIAKDLNLEVDFYTNGNKYIKRYNCQMYSKENIEIFLKPILKDKLKNIINR